MTALAESMVEQAALNWLADSAFAAAHGPEALRRSSAMALACFFTPISSPVRYADPPHRCSTDHVLI